MNLLSILLGITDTAGDTPEPAITIHITQDQQRSGLMTVYNEVTSWFTSNLKLVHQLFTEIK